MTARENESLLLDRCCSVARMQFQSAKDEREANVFRVASMLARSQYPDESEKLMHASERYFSLHPGEQLHTSEVIRKGWLPGLPRFRDMLTNRLKGVDR